MINLHGGCEKCKSHDAITAWEPRSQAFRSAKYVFIVEQPLNGLENKLKKLLRMCSFTSENIAVIYATRCTIEGVKPGIHEIKCCKPLLINLIEDTAQDAILVPMGANVCKELLGRKVGSVHGSVLEAFGRICVPTYHPLQVYAYPDSLPNFAKDLETIMQVGLGDMPTTAKTHYFYLDTLEKVKKVFDVLFDAPVFTFDIETTGLDPFATDPIAKVVTINFSNAAGVGYVVPIDHHEAPWTPTERATVVEMLRTLLEESTALKVPHNGKFDWKYLKQVLGIEVSNYTFDTMYAHYVGVTEEPGTHGLKSLAWEFTDMGGYDDPLEEYKEAHPEAETNYDLIPIELLSQYGAGDADCTFRLIEVFKPIIDGDEGLSNVFYNILMPAAVALAKIELRGAYIDPGHLEFCSQEFPKLLGEIHEQLREFPEVIEAEEILTTRARKAKKHERIQALLERKDRLEATAEKWGKDSQRYKTQATRLDNDIAKFKEEGVVVSPVVFSPASPDHKALLMYKVMGLPILKYTDKKKPSTDKEVLKELYSETESPVLQLLGRYTKINTLNNMFVKGMPDRLCADGKVRGSFNPIGTVTGRLSSSGPNLQQIPKNPKEDKFLADVKVPSIKKLFTVKNHKNWCIMQFDYSQAELRVLASLSGEETFIGAFKRGEDIHKLTASEVNGIELDEVTDGQRGAAKAVNFGLLYGQGAAKLAKGTGMSLSAAKDYIKLYFRKLPRIQRFIKHTHAHVRSVGEVRSPFGRIRRLATAFSPEADVVASAERQAVNSPIQSAASDCTLHAIIRITNWLEAQGLKSHIIVTVHDSIILAVYKPEAIRVYKMVKKIMESPKVDWLLVPMTADAEVGPDWGTLTKIDKVETLEEWLANN